jgi:hypothetical protein
VDQRAHQGDLLLHALGVAVELALAGLPEAELAQQQLGAAAARARVQAEQRPEEVEVLEGGHAPVEPRVLGEQADLGAHRLGLRDDVETADAGVAAAGAQDGAKHASRSIPRTAWKPPNCLLS